MYETLNTCVQEQECTDWHERPPHSPHHYHDGPVQHAALSAGQRSQQACTAGQVRALSALLAEKEQQVGLSYRHCKCILSMSSKHPHSFPETVKVTICKSMNAFID